jgi:hypothetical protein
MARGRAVGGRGCERRAGRTLARSIGEAALVACSERAVGLGCAEDPRPHRGPTAAQAGSGCDRHRLSSALSWENSGGPART